MIILISGTSHTGKTRLAQKMLEKYHYPYLSLDHLKMGLIRSGQTDLTPTSADKDLTNYLWPITREIIKTAIENQQNLIIEGCYLPFDWASDFDEHYLKAIRYYCLVMSENYIKKHFESIKQYANIIEHRLFDTDLTVEQLIQDNQYYLEEAKKHQLNYLFIDQEYCVEPSAKIGEHQQG